MSEMAFLLVILSLGSALDARAQQAHASLSDQKMCAAQAKKFFDETDYSDNSKHPLKNEFTSHYDPAAKVCYVRIDYNTRDGKTINVSSYVFDAFEGRELAEYIWFSQPDKKYWDVKPTMCHVKPINQEKTYCTTTEEFESLVDRLFGLGE
jgi:hypothetical protein